MKIKDGFMLKKVMDSYMVLSLNSDRVNSMQTLNETGAFLFNLLVPGCDRDKLCAALLAEYDVDEKTAFTDVDAFLDKLRASNLLDD